MDRNEAQESKDQKTLVSHGYNVIPIVSILLPDHTTQENPSSSETTPGCVKQDSVVELRVNVRFRDQSCGSCTSQIQEGDDKVVRDHILLNKISGYITNWEDILTLGLSLHSDPHDVRRLRNQSHSIKVAAYDVMSAFYDRISDVTEMWKMLIKALQELGLNKAVVDLGLDRLVREARAAAEVEADRK